MTREVPMIRQGRAAPPLTKKEHTEMMKQTKSHTDRKETSMIDPL